MTSRRQFIVGTGAALVTVPLSAMLLSDKVTKLPGRVQGRKSTLVVQDDLLPESGNSSVLIVVPTYREAVKIQHRMGNPQHVKVVGMGAMLCGYRADYIITDDACARYPWCDRQYKDWHNTAVRTRLTPTGSLIQSSFTVRTFDWGNHHGMAMQFVDLDRNEIKRNAIRIPKCYVSYDDRIEVKALLYKWWLRERGINV